MRIVFMGTPDFAVPTLQALIESRHEVVAVVTQPDKPRGRRGRLQPSPVKTAALASGILVCQPERVREPAFLEELRELSPDVIVVVAFGQILSKDILELPKYGCLNVHASLLPKLRGAAPIQWSVINGDQQSGVTIMQMDEGIDTGDILLVKEYTLKPKETGGSLFDTLAGFGGPMILTVLELAERGELKPEKQGEEYTYAKMLSRESGKLDFSRPALEIERLIRGLNPWPSAFCYLDGKMLKIWDADVLSAEDARSRGVGSEDAVPGTVTAVTRTDIVVKTGDGYLQLCSVQLEGKRQMEAEAFLRGHSLAVGTVLTQ